jgi:glutamate N-acetyltransferase/amino-acid N-acetyltransferase
MSAKIELLPEGTVTSAAGFKAGATFAGINKTTGNKPDLGILFSESPCVTVGLFTTSQIKAAPVKLCQQKLPSNGIRAIVANSGCANAATGKQGQDDAVAMSTMAASQVNIPLEDILVASTGIIGKRLPMPLVETSMKDITLSDEGGHRLAEAIMTTDTKPKEVAVAAGGFVIGGIAKGSGMIHPQLGTLLCFLSTDAMISQGLLSSALRKAVDISFNMVSIDGDTSPNDTVLVMSNGRSDVEPINPGTKQQALFQQALEEVCIYLAKAIASDGEGASKLIEATVHRAASIDQARLTARAIISSPLVKAAVHGNDPNWGRIIAAAGRSGADVVESRLSLCIDGLCLAKAGVAVPFDKEKVFAAMSGSKVNIELELNMGEATATAWGCDLSAEYVAINSSYSS